MSEFEYGFSRGHRHHQITMTAEPDFLDAAMNWFGPLEEYYLAAKMFKTIVAEPTDDGRQKLTFDFDRAFAKSKASGNRERSLKAATEALIDISNYAENQTGRVPLRALIGREPVAEGRLFMSVDVAWPDPEMPDNTLRDLATAHMRSVAGSLRYGNGQPFHVWRDAVFAFIHRGKGVTLQTEPMVSCSLDTTADFYDASQPRFEATAQNIYTPVQQIICLSGAIAIANAHDLLATGEASAIIET